MHMYAYVNIHAYTGEKILYDNQILDLFTKSFISSLTYSFINVSSTYGTSLSLSLALLLSPSFSGLEFEQNIHIGRN